MNISELWNEYADYVFNLCLRYVKDKLAAEDIRQEVFLRIVKSKELFKERAAVKTWLYSISFNCCVDYFRNRNKQRIVMKEGLRASGYILSDSKFPTWRVSEIFDIPCPISQLFIELHFREGWSKEEIAKVFGFKIVYVRKKIQFSIDRLQEML